MRAGTTFKFKDAIAPFTGHAVCSSTEWLNGLSNPTGESSHPNRTGHSSGYAPLVRTHRLAAPHQPGDSGHQLPGQLLRGVLRCAADDAVLGVIGEDP